ncbi:V-type proton ATPase subunit C-like protein [Tanacetum coccineum]
MARCLSALFSFGGNNHMQRSSKNLHEDNEYAIYTVTLFNRDADNFRTKARERGFQIRDFEYNSETQESRKQELEKLMQDQESLRSSLLNWCYTSYGEFHFLDAFLCWRDDNDSLYPDMCAADVGKRWVGRPARSGRRKMMETWAAWVVRPMLILMSLSPLILYEPCVVRVAWRGCWNKWHEFIGVKVRKWNCFLLTLLTHSRYCMGGALGIASSVFVPEIDAAVAFYGVPPTELADAAKIKQPAQAQFG